ncbi:MAG: hypothetical protein Q8M94_16480 [Ignavibacteria bacterium]|nr:hypothetical protein [Ignavibacteria bacterium]
MHNHKELIKFLSSTNVPINFVIDEIVFNKNHPQSKNLNSYLNKINEMDLQSILSNKDYKLFGKQIGSLSWEENARISFAKKSLFKELGKYRLKILSEENVIPSPYHLPEFKNIEIDSDNLISFSTMREIAKTSNNVFQILLRLPVQNSMYWCARNLFEVSKFCDIKIRLDPLFVFEKAAYGQMNYKMFVYGKPPELSAYNSLKELNHIRWMPDNFDLADSQFTDAVWIPKDNEIHIIFEEIPKVSSSFYCPSRYFHTIYNKEKNKIEHFDGAIRVYSDSEIERRINCHVKDIGKIGKRIKIFKIDSEIEIEKWSSVAASFFVWNSDVVNYFSN